MIKLFFLRNNACEFSYSVILENDKLYIVNVQCELLINVKNNCIIVHGSYDIKLSDEILL